MELLRQEDILACETILKTKNNLNLVNDFKTSKSGKDVLVYKSPRMCESLSGNYYALNIPNSAHLVAQASSANCQLPYVDCSGFVSMVLNYALMDMQGAKQTWFPSGSTTTYGSDTTAFDQLPGSTTTLIPGDLILWNGHIGIFVGSGVLMINSSGDNTGIIQEPYGDHGNSYTVLRIKSIS